MRKEFRTGLEPESSYCSADAIAPVKRANMSEAKAHLGRKRKPMISVAKGMITVPPSFFEPMPDDFLKAFDGE